MSPRRAVPQKGKSGTPSWLLAVGVAVIAVIVVIVAADFLVKIQTPSAAPSNADVACSGRTCGAANAPVNFVEFSDFQ